MSRARTANEFWEDSEAGPLVRAYAMTGGRVRPTATLDVVAYVMANAGSHANLSRLQPEHRAILAAARRPITVSELAAHLDLALGVTRILLGDLLEQDLISTYEPPGVSTLPSERVLKAVLHGLQAL
ncbi:DUF742 domain-containing protein [Planosporangium flavigriseum]|uniref:DUF742 domain-containing protein n=1 Tax=Planosporangium flavigriseum TaxID=373681 RepID=A0A8J3PM66_9ACTN|nr:DUF742 domain-containing protein [Planosporangium flavigriseum]NJC65712.1 DUF742 domain-containing protein [Planosporangium flavigriseum]GIG73563.1 hypothetical protein Pfl04_19670 [Planosporangium flavigriseum]